MSLSVDRATREGPSLTISSNANRVSVRSEEVGDGLPGNATLISSHMHFIYLQTYDIINMSKH